MFVYLKSYYILGEHYSIMFESRFAQASFHFLLLFSFPEETNSITATRIETAACGIKDLLFKRRFDTSPGSHADERKEVISKSPQRRGKKNMLRKGPRCLYWLSGCRFGSS